MRIFLYFLTLGLILHPNMADSVTNIVYFNDIQKVTNVNEQGLFSITKTDGAYLSYDVLPTIGANNLVLSLFLEGGEGIGETTEFLVYPVGKISQEAEAKGFIIKTETKKGEFVNITLPKIFFNGIEKPIGLVIKVAQEGTFVFRGLDETPNAAHLIIEGGEFPNIDEQQIALPPSEQEIQEQILKYAKQAAENSEKKWYEKPYFTIPMGIILGVLSTILFNILKSFFPLL